MGDEAEALDLARRSSHLGPALDRLPKKTEPPREEAVEEECAAFGYLRGIREQAVSLEFRLRTGNTQSFPYSWLGPVLYDPSVGLIAKFSGDLVYLILIRGSNLDAILPGRAVNLTDRGILRHRILWVREMDPEESRRIGQNEPTVDRIDIAECESHDDVRAWLKKVAPGIMRPRA